VALLSAPAGAQARRVGEYRELHMGVEVRIVLHARDDAHARGAARAAYDRIAALENITSDYRPESELRRFESRAGEWVPIGRDLLAVLSTALAVARASDGAFDPTVGPLVVLWREARRSGRLPNTRALDSARALVGWGRLVVDTAGARARLQDEGMRLDLGGVAKGYILQRALDELRAHGVRSALIEAGGDIAVGDAPPGERGWRVAAPFGDSAVRSRAAALSNAFVATSGPSAQVVEIGGRRYSHVVDPRTGVPLGRPVHATVIATDGAIADALATALTLVLPERREGLIAGYRDYVRAWSVRE